METAMICIVITATIAMGLLAREYLFSKNFPSTPYLRYWNYESRKKRFGLKGKQRKAATPDVVKNIRSQKKARKK